MRDYNNQTQLSRVLGSLSFPSMGARQEQLKDAYADTFNWVFEEKPDASLPFPSLLQWLRHESSIYWLSGKPGSGKSTVSQHLVFMAICAGFPHHRT